MSGFVRSLRAWRETGPGPALEATLKTDIAALPPERLPLQQALCHSSQVGGGSLRPVILAVEETPRGMRVKAGIFYTGVVAGSCCADDPGPLDEENEYCELLLEIPFQGEEVTVTLLPD